MAEITHPGDVVTKSGIKLPMWAWIIVGSAGIGGAYLLYRRHQAAAAATAGDQTSPALASGAAGPDNGSGFSTPTTILPIFQGTQPASSYVQDLYHNPPTPVAGYTVTAGHQYPAQIAMDAYKIPASDTLDLAVQSALIIQENLGFAPPYPVGTRLRVPANPNDTTHTKHYTAADHPDQTSPPQLTAQGTYTAF